MDKKISKTISWSAVGTLKEKEHSRREVFVDMRHIHSFAASFKYLFTNEEFSSWLESNGGVQSNWSLDISKKNVCLFNMEILISNLDQEDRWWLVLINQEQRLDIVHRH